MIYICHLRHPLLARYFFSIMVSVCHIRCTAGVASAQVSGLSMLVSLKMRKNSLTAVPAALFGLESLALLDLSGNAIRELPEELGAAVAMKVLLLSGDNDVGTSLCLSIFFTLSLSSLSFSSLSLSSLCPFLSVSASGCFVAPLLLVCMYIYIYIMFVLVLGGGEK